MSPSLADQRDLLDTAIDRTAETLGIPAEHVEKDFWLTEVLRGAARVADEENVPLFLKGGTSLSKVHRVIRRFSEDVDVLVLLDQNLNPNQRNVALKAICAGGATQIGVPDPNAIPSATRKGVKRAVHIPYDTTREPGVLRQEGVLLEVGWWGGTIPSQSYEVRSLIAEAANDIELEEFEEQVPLSVNVLGPERTLVEKLSIVHSAAADKDPGRRAAVARHYYDIWCLLEHEHTSMAVAVPTRIPELAQDVLAHSTLAGIASRPRPADGYQNSEAFDSSNENLAETRAAFHEQVANLIWPDSRFPDFDEICTFVRDCEISL